MSIDSRYKKEVDSFCSETYKVSSEEMLQMAKRNTSNKTNTISTKAKVAKRAVLIPVAAALFGMAAVSAAAGAAGYGPLSGLSDVFVKYFGDETTEKLADEGYIYTAQDYAEDSKTEPEKNDSERVYAVMGETVVKDGFEVKIVGMAGDTQDPQMLLDITVQDEQVAAQSDMLGVYMLVLGTEAFDNDRESYLEEYGKAVKDETDPKLFHASVRCPPAWVTTGQEIVADIVCIHTMEDNTDGIHKYYRDEEVMDHGFSPNDFSKSADEIASTGKINASNYYEKIKEHLTDIQFRFTVPDNIFKQSERIDYKELSMSYEIDGQEYHLCRGEFGSHRAEICLDFGLSPSYPAEEFNKSYENWVAAQSIVAKFTLNVDGKEYLPQVDNTGLYCDTEGNCDLCIKNRCYLVLFFPCIDIDKADNVILTVKDETSGKETSHDLKNLPAPEEPEDTTESEPAGKTWLDYAREDAQTEPYGENISENNSETAEDPDVSNENSTEKADATE